MIVDSHHHVWEIGRFEYPWMPGPGHVLHRNFLPEDLKPWLDKNGVNKTVIVQADQSVEGSGGSWCMPKSMSSSPVWSAGWI